MDTVKIGFFLEQMYGHSCCACDIGTDFLYGTRKERRSIKLLVLNLEQVYTPKI
jgi:hypothetical protein